MGFKFKRFNVTAGSAEWPTGTTDAIVQSRSEAVLKGCVQAIIDCNCGWQLDTTKNATINDLVAIPTRVSPYTYPGLFLTNSTSGCKLFVAYFGESPKYSIKDFSGNGDNLRVSATVSDSTSCGLCMSMIPEGSNSVFGDPSTTTFLPSDATRIIGTVNRATSSSTTKIPYGGDPSSGTIYSWGVFATPTTIAVSCKSSSANPGNLYVPAYAVGRVFGSLTHDTDTLDTAKYGCINFRVCSGSTSGKEGATNTITDYQAIYDNSRPIYFVGRDPETSGTLSNYMTADSVFGSIAKANGTWVNGTDTNSYCVTLFPTDVSQLSGYVYNSTNTGKSRWCPFSVRVISSDLDTYGIVAGDGVKGYLDTDLFRCAIGTYGQQFDNGNFICIDDDYNILIGWDSTNTDSIAGT